MENPNRKGELGTSKCGTADVHAYKYGHTTESIECPDGLWGQEAFTLNCDELIVSPPLIFYCNYFMEYADAAVSFSNGVGA
jgi:hypothetical protein